MILDEQLALADGLHIPFSDSEYMSIYDRSYFLNFLRKRNKELKEKADEWNGQKFKTLKNK